MEKRNIPYGRQHITQSDIDAVITTLQHPYLTQGPQVDAFEQAFADYVGARYAVAVSNGTAALHLCALALGVNEQTRVLSAPITFAASANCVRYCGGQVDFVDIDPQTATIDLAALRQTLEAAPAGTYQGIIPIDFAGYPVDLEQVRALADAHGLWIIEDACHAPGGYFTDQQGQQQNCGNGQFADLAIFSFHPVKHIASGEGGMITTNDADLYQKLLVLRTHGITKSADLFEQEAHGGWYYEMQDLGYNYRIPDILCALGLSQLQRAVPNLERRRYLAQRYDAAFAQANIDRLGPRADGGHAYHLYVILVNNRKALYDHLRQVGIYAQVHYLPVHTLPYYRSIAPEPVVLPQAEAYYERCLSLPMYPTLTDEEQDFVIEQVLAVAQ